MKLLCLSEDETFGKQVSTVADQLHWNVVMIQDRDIVSQAMRQFNPDLLLLDVAHPDGKIWWQRQEWVDKKPTLLFDSEVKEDFLVQALEGGADDCMRKPPSVALLAAKLKAILRRQVPSAGRRYVPNLDLLIDSERYLVEARGVPLNLTMTEFKILRELVVAEGKVVSRVELQSRVFGQTEALNRSLDVHVCALRKKFKSHNIDIDSVRGVGYRVGPTRQ
jgi:DNA-binding response OmpR family regulator